MPSVDTVRKNLQKRVQQFVEKTARGNAERQEIEIAVNNLYTKCGFKTPHVFVCQSPFQLATMPVLFEIFKHADRVVLSQLKLVVDEHQDDELFKGLVANAEKEFGAKIEHVSSTGRDVNAHELGIHDANDLRLATRSLDIEDIEEQNNAIAELLDIAFPLLPYSRFLMGWFDDSSKPKIMPELISLRDTLPAEALVQVNFSNGSMLHTWQALTSSRQNSSILSHRHMNRFRQFAPEEVYDRVERDRSIAFFDREVTQMNREMQLFQTPDLFWILLNHASLGDSREGELAKLWAHLSETVIAARFCENVCFVCPFPKSTIDDQLRHHNGEGPALETTDNQKLYAWRGLNVPDKVITDRNKTTTTSIDRELNLELRRVMLEIYGFENYVRDSKMKKIHEDDCGTLYRKGYWDFSERLQILEVVNSTPEPDGTFKRYFLRVPPDVETAREAVAWTFGLSESDYKPEKQS